MDEPPHLANLSIDWRRTETMSPTSGRLFRIAEVDQCIADRGVRAHAPGMFVVTEAEAATIRTIFDRDGELSAAVELRRLFPSITDTTEARECARTIAGWKPLPVPLRPVKRQVPRRS